MSTRHPLRAYYLCYATVQYRKNLKRSFQVFRLCRLESSGQRRLLCARNQSKTNFIQLPSQNQKVLNMTNYNKKQALDIGACN